MQTDGHASFFNLIVSASSNDAFAVCRFWLMPEKGLHPVGSLSQVLASFQHSAAIVVWTVPETGQQQVDKSWGGGLSSSAWPWCSVRISPRRRRHPRIS